MSDRLLIRMALAKNAFLKQVKKNLIVYNVPSVFRFVRFLSMSFHILFFKIVV